MARIDFAELHIGRNETGLVIQKEAILPVSYGMIGDEFYVMIEGLARVTYSPEETQRLKRYLIYKGCPPERAIDAIVETRGPA